MKKPLVRTIKLLLTLAFIYLLWRMADKESLLERFTQIDLRYLALFGLVGIAMLLVSNAKWFVLMGVHGERPGFWATLRIYFIGYYFSALLPSNFGGDAARIVLASKHTGSTTAAATSVFMERVTGLVMLMALVAIMPLLAPALLWHPAFLIPAVLCAGALVLLLAMAIVRQRVSRGARVLSRWLVTHPRTRRLAPVVDWLTRFFADAGKALRALSGNRRIALQVWLLTAAFYGLVWLNVLVAYRTFSFDPPLAFVFMTPIAQFMTSLPVSAGGNLGYSEGVFAYYFSLVGIAVEATVAMAVLLRLKIWFLGLIGLGFFLGAGGRSKLGVEGKPSARPMATPDQGATP